MKWLFVFLSLFFIIEIYAQETLDWDIDSLFDEPSEEVAGADESNQEQDTNEITVLEMINRRGFIFDISYGASAGVYPGWTEPLWYASEENDFSWNPAFVLSSSFNLDARLSRTFRVMSNVNFAVPDISADDYFKFNVGDVFFDYNLLDTVFFRGGKYNLKWGISSNYGFTNLLARIPDETRFTNASLILKADIPVGVGGFQVLALTRANLFNGDRLNMENIGFGGKYNLALRKFDIDTGTFYQQGMPLRVFLSLKTTLGSTELYSEGLSVFDFGKPLHISGAFNIGFAQGFLNNKLTVNGEFFYNNEGNSFFYNSATTFRKATTSPFVEGVNIAMNLAYNFGGKGSPRFYLQTLYAIQDMSARIIPAFSLNPISHVNFYFALPMDLSDRDSYYYDSRNSLIENRNNSPLRFAIIFLVSFTGNLRFTSYSQN